MSDKMKNIDFYKLFIYVGFGLVNFIMWLFLMGIAFSMMTSCTSSKPKTPTFDELKEQVADKDTLTKGINIAIPIKPDSAFLTIIPDLLPVDVPVLAIGKKGRITLTATRNKDNSLYLSAIQKADTVRDTIQVKVPVYIFNECKVDGHIDRQEAEKRVQAAVNAAIREDRKKRNSQALNIGLVVGAMFMVVILILALIKRLLP
jgi:hypothetical protein